jgi:hypothetical protein
MILTKLDKTPVYIREIDSAWPKGQATVVISKVGERFIVSEGFSQIMAMMAPGTGAQPQPHQLTQSQRDSGGGVVSMTIQVLEETVSIDPSTAPSLVTYLTNHSECIALLEYWFTLHQNHFGSYPTIISEKNVGVICACVSKQFVKEAMDILEWQWTSNHYRAKYLRDKGMLDPATVLNASRRVDNYAMAQQAKLESMQQHPTTSEVRFCPDTGALLP